jgi:hypothetical protein
MKIKLPKHCTIPFYIFITSLFLSLVFFFFIRPADTYNVQIDIKLPSYSIAYGRYYPLSYSEARTIINSKASHQEFINLVQEKYKTNSKISDSINDCAFDIKNCIQILFSNQNENYLSILISGRSSESVFEISKSFQNYVIESLNHLSQANDKKSTFFNSAEPLHGLSVETKIYIGFFYAFCFFIALFSTLYITFLFIISTK